jgi:exodeoxyribonuclease-3
VKITTWNVNGIRAALNKGVEDWWQRENPNVLCLQEIKAMPEQLTKAQLAVFDDFNAVWNPAQRRGYSGVATFSRVEPLETRIGMGNEVFDIEGRVIQSRYANFILFNIYFPNGQRDQERLDYKLGFYEHLLDICDQLHADGENIIITGDFNTAHNEIDLKNPKENQNTSGFMPVERAWIDKYLEHGFVDAYRVLYPDRVEYTWWTYRFRARERGIGWRLDYYLVSEGLMPQIDEVRIHGDIMGSDHCPVSMILRDD